MKTAETEWKPLIRMVDDQPQQTDQEWAEICYVPNWAGHSRRSGRTTGAPGDPRTIAPTAAGRCSATAVPATQEFASKGTYKLFGIVTNRKDAGDQVIWWLRERCGKSEEVHSVMKSDLAGGQLPSALFGANAAWWALMILAHNLNTAMKRLVLGKDWATKRMKALRFRLISLPGRVVNHARKLIIRLGAGTGSALATIVNARQAIRALNLRTGRMNLRNRSRGIPGLATSHRMGGSAPLCPKTRLRTRGGCTALYSDSPSVQHQQRERVA